MTTKRFKPGTSGNPKGRPKGIVDKRAKFRDLIGSNSKKILQKVVDLALEGDTTCLKLCIDRIISPYRPVDKAVKLGDVQGTLTDKGQAIIKSMLNGELSPSEATSMLSALTSLVKITEFDDLEKRIVELEQMK